MAYTAQEAVTFIKKYLKDIPLDQGSVDLILCNQINGIIHRAFPWRWTVNELTPISLVDNTQDYAIADSDFYRLLRARIVRTDLTPPQYRDISIVKFLPLESLKGQLEAIRQVAFYEVGTKIRLSMRAHIVSPVTMQIQGEYQKTPTKLTALDTNLTIPDHYFDVFTEGLLWRAYKYADDPRAGTVQVVKNGSVVYTGQMGVFYALLAEMKVAEDSMGDEIIFPETPLGTTDASGFGLFGGG